MEKKYEMIKDGKYFTIRALRDFGDVHKGDIGGFIQSEKNLSHEGNCWIKRNAYVKENAVVSENALIEGGSCIKGNAQICGNARVEKAWIYGNAIVTENARIACDACIKDESYICGDAVVWFAYIFGKSKIGGNAFVGGFGFLKDAFIRYKTDVIFMSALDPDNSIALTFYTCKDSDGKDRICVSDIGACWMLDEFNEYISKTYADSFYAQTYRMAAKMAKFQIVQGFKAARDEEQKRAGMMKTDPAQQTAEVVSAPKAVEIAPSQKAAETVPTETLEKTA